MAANDLNDQFLNEDYFIPPTDEETYPKDEENMSNNTPTDNQITPPKTDEIEKYVEGFATSRSPRR